MPCGADQSPFPYNTLQCMGGIALMNDQPLVAEMASNMAEIFRYSIKEGDKVTVREETDFLKKYLDICDVRFNGRFRWEMEMEEGIGELPIDKMILQPLVENAVYHGLEKRTEPGGMLWIKGRREGQSLVFSIIDNGGRLEGERLAKLQETLADRELLEQERRARKRIGLVNIQSRLKLMYGEEGGTYRGREGRKGDCDSETSHRRNGHL
ncbi:MAG: sensor histidine kinase [Eisenbergiella sp.]